MDPADGRAPGEARPIEAGEHSRSEAAERDFFAHTFGQRAYHAKGWLLQKQRELRVLLEATRGRTLGRVLSIGCGEGAFERLLAPHAESVLGVDLSPEAIEEAEHQREGEGIRNVAFRCASFRELPWQERFDTIVCLAFLHHVPEPELVGLLRDCRAHLAPRGLFFSPAPNVRGALRAVGRIVLGRHYHAFHTPGERELDPVELAGLLRSVGFADVAIRHVDLTLIPACYALPRAPAWLFHLAALTDRLWCASPLAPWSSGFAAIARVD